MPTIPTYLRHLITRHALGEDSVSKLAVSGDSNLDSLNVRQVTRLGRVSSRLPVDLTAVKLVRMRLLIHAVMFRVSALRNIGVSLRCATCLGSH